MWKISSLLLKILLILITALTISLLIVSVLIVFWNGKGGPLWIKEYGTFPQGESLVAEVELRNDSFFPVTLKEILNDEDIPVTASLAYSQNNPLSPLGIWETKKDLTITQPIGASLVNNQVYGIRIYNFNPMSNIIIKYRWLFRVFRLQVPLASAS